MEVPVPLPSEPTGDNKLPSAKITEPSDLQETLNKGETGIIPTNSTHIHIELTESLPITKIIVTTNVGGNVQVEELTTEDGKNQLDKVNCLYKSCWKI